MIYYCEYNTVTKRLMIRPAMAVVTDDKIGVLIKKMVHPNEYATWIDGQHSLIIAFNEFERLLRANRIEI